MNEVDIVRAWKDEAYRASLTYTQRGTLPENPAGLVELNDVDLEGLVGGNGVLADLGSGLGSRTYRPCPPRACPAIMRVARSLRQQSGAAPSSSAPASRSGWQHCATASGG